MKDTVFISVETLKERTGLHANVDPKLVISEIMTAQDMYILPLLGTALYVKLQNDIEGSGTTGNYTTLVNDYITNALVYYTMAELPMPLTIQFYNKGLIRKTSENTDNPDMKDLIMIADRYRTRAEFYAQRLVEYLKANHTLFAEYDSPGSTFDTILPENGGYEAPMYLGEDCPGTYLPVSDSNFKRPNCRR
jgi:hypothetical protein